MGNTQSSEPSTPASELYPSPNASNDDNNQGKTSTVPVKYGDNVPIDSQKSNSLGSSVFGLEGVKFDLGSSMKHSALQNKVSKNKPVISVILIVFFQFSEFLTKVLDFIILL